MTSEQGHRWFAAMYNRFCEPMNRRQVAPILADLLSDVSGDVLEIGAGGGATFEHYPASARVLAIEPDPYMRRYAQPRLRPNIRLEAGSGEQLPAGDQSMDAVVSSLVLCTVADAVRTLAEARRVLKPQGRFIFIEHVRSRGWFGRVQDLIQPVYGRLSGGCHMNRRTEDAIARAGFTFDRLDHRRMSGIQFISGVARASADG
jgi:ubiquinone/menaquinone biosynthesis C-methylase UbiE